MIIHEGGNTTAINTKTQEITTADKIPLDKIKRQDFVKKMQTYFLELNKMFEKKFKTKIWKDETQIKSGFVFNGSTSFIFNPEYSDKEVTKHKPSVGDIDITVPMFLKTDLYDFLHDLQGKEVNGITYKGSNKTNRDALGMQINSVVYIKEYDINVQVDFEFLEYKDDKPTEWAKFSHSSSFEDAKQNIKAVHHKYLIRALVGGASVRDDILICTPSSTPEKFKLKKMTDLPRMLKFSVDRGIRIAYEPLIDKQTQEIVQYQGKDLYRELKTSESDYETVVANIYKLSFKQLESSDEDVKKFGSFVGILELCKKYLSKTEIARTHERYLNLLWGYGKSRGQELEKDNPTLDFEVKNAGYQKFIKFLRLKDESQDLVTHYYEQYNNGRQSFMDYLNSKS